MEIKIQVLNQELEKLVGDLTQANRELSDSLEFSKTVISESPVGIAIYKETEDCIAANQAIANLVGTSQSQVLEQNFRTTESWKEAGLFDAANRTLRENKKTRLEVNVKPSCGKPVILDCQLVPFQSRVEKNLMVIFSDITERKQAKKQY